MAGSIKLQGGTLQVVADGASSPSNATLANNTRVKAGTLDNTTLLAPLADVAMSVGFSVAPTPGAGIVVACYLVPYVDGTNPGDVDTTTPRFPSNTFAGNFEVIKSQTGAQILVLQAVPLDALKYDVYLDNQSGQTMATGWTVKAAPTQSQYT